jgi:hypothetical protein
VRGVALTSNPLKRLPAGVILFHYFLSRLHPIIWTLRLSATVGLMLVHPFANAM